MKMFLAAALATVLAYGFTPAFAAENTSVSNGDLAKRGLTVADFPRWKQLASNIYAYEGVHAPDPEGRVINTVSLIVIGSDGVLVADGQGDPAQGQAMVDNIKKLTAQPVKYMIVASDHIDHVGGDAAFKKAWPGIVFVSTPVSQRNLAKNENPPTETITDKRAFKMGNIDVQVMNLGRAHTGGDLAVYLPASKILFMSEIYLRGVFPAMRSAYPTEWVETIKKAQAMDVSLYVPGHGFIDDPATMKRDLEESRKAIVAVIAEAKRLHDAKIPCVVTPPQPGQKPTLCEAAQKANWGSYADLGLASSQGQLAVVKVYQEIEGKLP
ncbi:MAG: MBL fold metallo-hydrolase [Rhodospirillaceae bacterium]|nr:MBL fold metallo-hydrolase [Rhodospirillaceae bacterium]